MNRNYRNVDRKIWRIKYIHEHHDYDTNNAGYRNVGTFPQKNWYHCMLRKCVMCKSTNYNKTSYFCLKTKLHLNGNVRNFYCKTLIFIIRLSEVCFRRYRFLSNCIVAG